jgi:hypothetical protein
MIDAAAMLCAAALSRFRARSIGMCATGRAELDAVCLGLLRPLTRASDFRLRCLAMLDFEWLFPDMLGGKVNRSRIVCKLSFWTIALLRYRATDRAVFSACPSRRFFRLRVRSGLRFRPLLHVIVWSELKTFSV